MADESVPVICPLCRHRNERGALHCAGCRAHLGQARAMAALARRMGEVEKLLFDLQTRLDETGASGPEAADLVEPEPEVPARPAPAPVEVQREPPPPPRPVREETPLPRREPVRAAPPAAVEEREARRPPAEEMGAGAAATLPAGITLPDNWRSSEFWLNKVGIGLVLLALAFLFSFAVDQGWLTPAVRVGIGLAIATLLMGFGLRLRRRRPHFAQVLQGGGLAAYYISGFAAFQLYELVNYGLAFLFMSLVTAAGFGLAVRQNAITISLLATVGGLSTPFLLGSEEAGSLAGLIGYTCLILALATAIYFIRGERVLLWVSNGGGWLILLLAYGMLSGADNTAPNRAALVAGIIFAATTSWAIPVLRRARVLHRPGSRPPARFGIADTWLKSVQELFSIDLYLLTLFVPVIAYALAGDILTFSVLGWGREWGVVALMLAALFWIVGGLLARLETPKQLDTTHMLEGLVFLCIGLPFLLDGNGLFLAYVVAAVVLHVVAVRAAHTGLQFVAHLLTTGVAFWLAGRLFFRALESPPELPVLNATALTNLLPLVLLAGVSFAPRFRGDRFYRIGAAIFLAVWFWSELDGDILLIVLTVQMVLLYGAALWRSDLVYGRLVADVFAVGLAAWTLLRLSEVGQSPALLNGAALADLFFIAVLLGVAWRTRGRLGTAYLVAAYAGFLAWLWRELDPLRNGQAFITVAWGILGVTLLVVALRRDLTRVRYMALGTLGLVVGKLLLVDLAAVNTFLRILLFFGVGGAFLLLSYFYQVLSKAGARPTDP